MGDSEIEPGKDIKHAFVALDKIRPDADLGTLCTNDSNCNSRAFDINNRLQIVGFSGTDSGQQSAFLKDPYNGMLDLNKFIPEEDSFYFRLEEASAINELGQIAGFCCSQIR